MKLQHPNIIALFGHCDKFDDTGNYRKMMVIELALYGDLNTYLKSRRPTSGRRTATMLENNYLIADDSSQDISHETIRTFECQV